LGAINTSDWRRSQLSKLKNLDKYAAAFKNMGTLPIKDVKALTVAGASTILVSAKRKCTSSTVRNALGFITKNDSKYPTTTLIGIRNEFKGNKGGSKTLTVPAHAAILEYGTTERITKDGSSRGAVLPRPFWRNSIDENKDKIFNQIKSGLMDIIDKQATKNKIK
jgi:hypothetical protein